MISNSIIEPKVAKDARALKKRVERFLAKPKYGAEASAVMDCLSAVGTVAMFGGAVRDLALYGANASPRDIDLVIECDDDNAFDAVLNQFHPQKNRFGGYRFRTEWWSFDVWKAKETWAAREGLVNVRSLDDLPQTTFFDWDALLYVYTSREVRALPGYFDRLSKCIVDVNLEENPNRLGALTRALRILVLGQVYLGPRLVKFARESLAHFEFNQVLLTERHAFSKALLSYELLVKIRAELDASIRRGESNLCWRTPVQLEFRELADEREPRNECHEEDWPHWRLSDGTDDYVTQECAVIDPSPPVGKYLWWLEGTSHCNLATRIRPQKRR